PAAAPRARALGRRSGRRRGLASVPTRRSSDRRPGRRRRHPHRDRLRLARAGVAVLLRAQGARPAAGAGAVRHLRERGDHHEPPGRPGLSAPRPAGAHVSAPAASRRAVVRARRRAALQKYARSYAENRAGLFGLAALVLAVLVAVAAPLFIPAEALSVTGAP